MRFSLTGLVAAVHTPLRADGSLHLDRVGRIVEHHVGQELGGIMVCGSTGEGPLLTTQERRAVAEAYVNAARGKLKVIVHVGHSSVAEARGLASHAQELGADGVVALSPWYAKPSSAEVLAACCAEIAAGAPELPFYYYHIPSMTGVHLPMTDLLRRAGDLIPNFVGVKYTSPTIPEFQSCVAFDGGRFDVLYGTDEMLLAGLAAGARGAIGSTYNFAAPLYRRLWSAFNRGDLEEARACQQRSVDFLDILYRHRNQPAIKAVMKLIGIDCGPSRLPLVTLTSKELSDLERDLSAIGFFEWALEAPARLS